MSFGHERRCTGEGVGASAPNAEKAVAAGPMGSELR